MRLFMRRGIPGRFPGSNMSVAASAVAYRADGPVCAATVPPAYLNAHHRVTAVTCLLRDRANVVSYRFAPEGKPASRFRTSGLQRPVGRTLRLRRQSCGVRHTVPIRDRQARNACYRCTRTANDDSATSILFSRRQTCRGHLFKAASAGARRVPARNQFRAPRNRSRREYRFLNDPGSERNRHRS